MPDVDHIQAVIFDFDGTLVDASIPILRSFNIALEGAGFPAEREEDIRSLIGRPLAAMFRTVAPDAPDAIIDDLFNRYRVAFPPLGTTLSKPMPGLDRLLRELPRDIKLGIATSRISDGAVSILTALGYLERFEVIIGLEHVKKPKPDPEPVLMALRQLEVKPHHALMVGDVSEDMQAGKRAGAGSIGLVSEQHTAERLYAAGADQVIKQLDELLTLLPHSTKLG